MIYPENFEIKIGFDAVRRMVAEKCESDLGRRRVDAMEFSDDYALVSERVGRVAEFKTIIGSGDDFPSGGIRDLTVRLKAIRPEGTYLTASELLDLSVSLQTMAAISNFFSSRFTDEGTTPYPLLSDAASRLGVFPALCTLIGRVVDRWGGVKDNASPELADIRSRLSRMSGTIASVMRRVIANAVRDGYLEPDTTPGMRDGRLVIPVAPMNKRRISGIVHDESASGKTVFIEPAEVVEVNNRLRELQIEEQREVTRILISVASDLRPHLDDMLSSFDILGLFDFIRAKALWAVDAGGNLPHLSREPEMEWYHACHPVLQRSLARHGKEIVPLDIRLTPKERILVISGPNAGGKSVTLKTVGIVQYMLQCGLLPPVYENSHMGVFRSIFIDIGDDQSLEDDLSTYSSHLRNMKRLLASGDSRTLMLIDEFGSGTEPQIGGAIAQALLAEFNAKGMWGVVTTHFQNLKKFAEETAGLVNGSMLYDRREMRPMFALAIGNPGSSFAIEIARKIGLPESIISAAGEIVGSDYVNLDKYLLDIARDRRYWENKRQQIRQKEKRIDDALERYEDAAETLRRQRREIIEDARREASKILDGSNAAIERTIHDIRQAQAEREQTLEARRRLREQKEALASGTADISEPAALARAPKSKKHRQSLPDKQKDADTRPIAAGDYVLLDGAGTPGVVEEIRQKDAVVIFGHLRTSVKLSRLSRTMKRPSSGAAKSPALVTAATSEASRERQLNFKQEIDVRGMRVDEAIQAVTYFIDDAIQFNASRVRILHGTGTGALRQYIRQYLDTVGPVRRYADEDVRFGGAGITVVEL
ncbi:MAG: Smr/MutS family protein [Muribaculaceae bacterium]|nr:Smr/MutS family protein [Muribaculaceae bacterium]